jgi:hypothetical protein
MRFSSLTSQQHAPKDVDLLQSSSFPLVIQLVCQRLVNVWIHEDGFVVVCERLGRDHNETLPTENKPATTLFQNAVQALLTLTNTVANDSVVRIRIAL